MSKFIARWAAQAKLDIDPGLVSLRLVQRGPDRLTKEPAARLKLEHDAITLDSADTLAEAGLADGSWLVVEFASRTPSGSTLEVLLQHENPMPGLLSRMRLRFPQQVYYAETTSNQATAVEVYHMVQQLPSTTTLNKLRIEGYHMTGELFNGSLLQTCVRGLLPHVIKPLEKNELERARAFTEVVGEPHGHPYIIPFVLRTDAAKEKSFMIMPQLVQTLEPIRELSDEHVLQLWTQMCSALEFLHAHGFAHCDVKPSNIGLREKEPGKAEFCLLDLGSLSQHGKRTSSTPACVPSDYAPQNRAAPALDWWMLGMTLAEKGCGSSGIEMGFAAQSITKAALLAHLAKHLVPDVWQELQHRLDASK